MTSHHFASLVSAGLFSAGLIACGEPAPPSLPATDQQEVFFRIGEGLYQVDSGDVVVDSEGRDTEKLVALRSTGVGTKQQPFLAYHVRMELYPERSSSGASHNLMLSSRPRVEDGEHAASVPVLDGVIDGAQLSPFRAGEDRPNDDRREFTASLSFYQSSGEAISLPVSCLGFDSQISEPVPMLASCKVSIGLQDGNRLIVRQSPGVSHQQISEDFQAAWNRVFNMKVAS